MGEWTKERIEAAEKRCEKATAGPWWRGDTDDNPAGEGDCVYVGERDVIATELPSEDDATFIAHARTDLPDALAEIKAAAVALDAEISRSDKVADRPYSLAERIEFVIVGLDREARRGDCAEDEVKRLALRIQGLEQANREAHQAIAKSKAHIDAADRRGDHAAQDRDTYKRERDEAQTELARVLAHIATLPAWCAPIPPPGLRPAALGGECARCLARPGYHEGSCVCRMARTDVTPSQSRVLKAAEEWHNAASLGCPRDCSAWDKERRVGQAERELLNAVRACHAKTDQDGLAGLRSVVTDKAAQVTEDVIGQALTVASGAQAVESVAVAARATVRIDDGSLGGYAPSDDGPTSL